MQAPRLHPLPLPPLPPMPTGHHRSHSLTTGTSGGGSVRRKPAQAAGVERMSNPWEDMTYAWVAEQDYNLPKRKHGRKTEEWVFKQAGYYPTEDIPVTLTRSHHAGLVRSGSLRRDPAGAAAHVPRRTQPKWEEVIYRYEVDAERWMRHEEESRRLAQERMRTRTRIDDDLRRIDERIRQRKEEQRRVLEEGRARSVSGLRENERKERARLEKAAVGSWEKYEARWSEIIASSSEPLTFSNIPWPTVIGPKTVEDISSSAVTAFLLSGAHSQQTSRKERIRSAQLRWHPDRFRRLMGRVAEEEKTVVEEGVGSVARILNDLMVREKRSSK